MRFKLTLISIAATVTLGAHAAEWSDTSVALSYGTKFTEPFGATDVSKNIYLLKHVSGDKYGENLFKAEMLQSNSKNPGTNDSAGGAQEVYAIYRRLFDLQKMSGTSYAFGPFKNIGVTAGFDWNTKNDAYGSKKRMFVIGPTFITDINNGFFNELAP